MKNRFIDPYTDENGVLKNKLGITNQQELDKKEADLSAFRLYELKNNPISNKFDFAHLKEIHKHLFQDVYEWAGESRTIDITKGHSVFCNRNHIDSFAAATFKEIQKDNKAMKLATGAFKNDLPAKLAKHFGEINALHPFREGNGRAQKVFIGQLAENHGLKIEWRKMDKNQLIEASKESMVREPELLTKLITQHSTSLQKTTQSQGIKRNYGTRLN